MKTADQLYAEQGPANSIALNGVHLFAIREISYSDVEETVGACVLHLGGTKIAMVCVSLLFALHYYQLSLERHYAAGGMNRDLPTYSGWVSVDGEMRYWISTNGKVHACTYLGRSGQAAATAPMRAPV